MMADLPQEGCTETAPFTYCGADMFGLLIVNERRSELKHYGALFNCFSSRAVHIEITNSLYADSFVLALCRFMAIKEQSVQSGRTMVQRVQIELYGTTTYLVLLIWEGYWSVKSDL